jgi:hypothetical protein
MAKPKSYVAGGRVTQKNMISGGRVKAKGRIPKTITVKMDLDQNKGSDRVPAILAAGELVIPKRLTNKVAKFLKKEGDHIPGL